MGVCGASQEVPAPPLHPPLPREPCPSLLPPHGLHLCLRLPPALQVSCGQPPGGGAVCGPPGDVTDSGRLCYPRGPALLPHNPAVSLPEQRQWLHRVWTHQIHRSTDSILLPSPPSRSGVCSCGCGLTLEVFLLH